jgi:hypothetical protein
MYTTRLIEAYLDGSLEKDLAEEMKVRAANDFEFAELIRLHKEVNESIHDNELEQLRHTLRKISSENDILGKVPIFPIRRIIQVAAACLFIFVMGTAAIIWYFSEYAKSTVFEKYYTKYDPDVITRSEKLPGNSLEKAQFLYQTGDYKPCVVILEEIVSHDKQNYMSWFYLGLARIELNQPDIAVTNFLKIPPDWNSPYQIHRNWYLALCLIKTGHEKEAGSLLLYLASCSGFYSERAGKILEKNLNMNLR